MSLYHHFTQFLLITEMNVVQANNTNYTMTKLGEGFDQCALKLLHQGLALSILTTPTHLHETTSDFEKLWCWVHMP